MLLHFSFVSIAFIVIDCGHPGDIENGNVTFTTTTFGSIATYSCEDGYYPDRYPSRFCDQFGNWSGNVPTCVVSDKAHSQAIHGNIGGIFTALQ